MQLFLSYRRGDVGGYAGRLTDQLSRRLVRGGVFHDVTTIAPGQDFRAAIETALNRSDAVLALIGPGWLARSPGQDGPRLFETDDVVRLELARALDRGARVVPVLVGGARLPGPDELPEDLRGLAQRQAVTLHDETWHEDVRGLLDSLRGAPPSRPQSRRWVLGVVLAVALLTAVALVWVKGNREDATTAPLPTCPVTTPPTWTPLPLGPSPLGEVQTSEGPLAFSVSKAFWRTHGSGWEVVLDATMENKAPTELYHSDYRYQAIEIAQRRFEEHTCFTGDDSEPLSPGTKGDATVGFSVRCAPVGLIKLVLDDDTSFIISGAGKAPGNC